MVSPASIGTDFRQGRLFPMLLCAGLVLGSQVETARCAIRGQDPSPPGRTWREIEAKVVPAIEE